MSQQESRTGDARLDALADALTRHFDGQGCETLTGSGEVTLVAPAENWLQIATALRDREDLR